MPHHFDLFEDLPVGDDQENKPNEVMGTYNRPIHFYYNIQSLKIVGSGLCVCVFAYGSIHYICVLCRL